MGILKIEANFWDESPESLKQFLLNYFDNRMDPIPGRGDILPHQYHFRVGSKKDYLLYHSDEVVRIHIRIKDNEILLSDAKISDFEVVEFQGIQKVMVSKHDLEFGSHIQSKE